MMLDTYETAIEKLKAKYRARELQPVAAVLATIESEPAFLERERLRKDHERGNDYLVIPPLVEMQT